MISCHGNSVRNTGWEPMLINILGKRSWLKTGVGVPEGCRPFCRRTGHATTGYFFTRPAQHTDLGFYRDGGIISFMSIRKLREAEFY